MSANIDAFMPGTVDWERRRAERAERREAKLIAALLDARTFIKTATADVAEPYAGQIIAQIDAALGRTP